MTYQIQLIKNFSESNEEIIKEDEVKTVEEIREFIKGYDPEIFELIVSENDKECGIMEVDQNWYIKYGFMEEEIEEDD